MKKSGWGYLLPIGYSIGAVIGLVDYVRNRCVPGFGVGIGPFCGDQANVGLFFLAVVGIIIFEPIVRGWFKDPGAITKQTEKSNLEE
ncbi:MAG: hypothetical protein ACXWP5_15515, partial [Bdellovibrionota bacterium]